MKQQYTDILIIGIGLAGMTAAITAAKSGKKLPLLPKQTAFPLAIRLGRKEELYIKD